MSPLASENGHHSTIVGVPKEVKVSEFRVGLTPAASGEYCARGHTVLIQAGAGVSSGFLDEDYVNAGCSIVSNAREVYERADMIVKVKEPTKEEYSLIRENQVVFTYFHFAGNLALTHAMMSSRAICIAYETVQLSNGVLPLLLPMSEIAGRMATLEAAKMLEYPMGGGGVLISGVPGVRRGKVVILGGGIVGRNAAMMACGMGAETVVLDISSNSLRSIEAELPKNCRTLFSNRENIKKEIADADVVIGAVLIPGGLTPTLLYKEDLKLMKKGSVIIDVAVDQGGCVETCKPTTHENPTFIVEGILHYCVANMPGAVPYTSTVALNNATLPYGLMLADKGWKEACLKNEELRKGLNIIRGHITNKKIAETFGLPCGDFLSLKFE